MVANPRRKIAARVVHLCCITDASVTSSGATTQESNPDHSQKKTRHGSVPYLVNGRAKGLGFQAATSAFQAEKAEAEKRDGSATLWHAGRV